MKNTVNLIGRIGNDIEVKTFENGILLNISLGVNDDYFNNEKVKVERTQWINLTARNKTAELINKHFKKGDQLAITGKITVRNYDNAEGQKIYVTEVLINDIVWEACKN